MYRYLVYRSIALIPTLLGVTLLLFLLVELMPGDAVTAMMSPEAPTSRAMLEELRIQLGLDQPWPIRYVRWIFQLLRGSLGYSYIDFTPVGKAIVSRLPATLLLMGTSMLISILLGVFLGVWSAIKPYSILDKSLTVFAFLGQSIPPFFLAFALIYFFGLKLKWLPVSGIATPGIGFSLVDRLKHLALPLFSLSFLRVAVFMRHTRGSMLEVLKTDYLRVARAKGLPEYKVIFCHAFRNALIPIVTIVGLNIPHIFAGAVIIESVFQWPGIGLLYVKAVQYRDHPMIMGLALMSAMITLISNLLTDLMYVFIDPRIKYD